MCSFSIILILKKILTFQSQRVQAFCWIKLPTLIKMKRNRKWKIPCIFLDRRTLCFPSYKNCKLKIKVWWVRGRKKEKRAFFLSFILSEGIFFKICVLPQRQVYWIHFQNIYTFTYQKTLLHTPLRLFLKLLKAFIVSLILFRMGGGGGGVSKKASYQFFPGNFDKRSN